MMLALPEAEVEDNLHPEQPQQQRPMVLSGIHPKNLWAPATISVWKPHADSIQDKSGSYFPTLHLFRG